MGSSATLKAVVRDGRLTLNEPTELPEGEVVELVPADPYSHLDDADELDDGERARLDAALESAWKDHQAGVSTHSAEEVLTRLRAKA